MIEPKYAYIVRRLQRVQLLRTISCRRATANIAMHMRQLPLLEYIIDHPDSTQIEIASALRVSAQSVALSTKRMSAAGLIEKRIDDNSLRCKRLCVTDKGRAVSAQCREQFDALDERMCNGLSEAEIHMFCDMLDRMAENLCDETLSGLSVHDLRAMVCEAEDNDNKNKGD